MELNVAYSSDDSYCRHLLVSIMSLLEHNTEFSSINIFVLSNSISEDKRKLLTDVAASYGAEICFVAFSSLAEKLHTDGTFSVSSFGRLFLDDFIPKDKVLYLDCDSVINDSFYKLMQTNMDNNICCAVQDNVSSYYKKAIGLQPNDVYFNAGFLLIDLKKWREEKMQEKAIQMIEHFHGSVPHHDQGVLNSICYKRIKQLHPKYNFQCPMFEYTPKELQVMNPGYYSAEELQQAKQSPVFIHYTEGFSNRPWRDTCTHPYMQLYRGYQDRTPFAGQLDHAPINRNSQILLFVYKHFPFFIYRVLLSVILQIKSFKRK